MKLEICNYGDPVLRQSAAAVKDFGPELAKLAGDMIDTMRAYEGVGLAAQQIGRALSICVVEVPLEMDKDEAGERLHPGLEMPLVLVNPVLSEPSDKTETSEEGCLSFPDVRGNITRALEIKVTGQDLAGTKMEFTARQFLARVIQHEVDHLNGVLFIDRMSAAKRIGIAGRIKRLKRETENRLGLS